MSDAAQQWHTDLLGPSGVNPHAETVLNDTRAIRLSIVFLAWDEVWSSGRAHRIPN